MHWYGKCDPTSCRTNTIFNPERSEGGIHPQPCFSLCCAKTVNLRKLKLCDVYYKLISLHFKHRLISWDTHCCHGNTIVAEFLSNFRLKSLGNCSFSAKIIVNCQSQLIFVISLLILPPMQNFSKIGEVLVFYLNVIENKR